MWQRFPILELPVSGEYLYGFSSVGGSWPGPAASLYFQPTQYATSEMGRSASIRNVHAIPKYGASARITRSELSSRHKGGGWLFG